VPRVNLAWPSLPENPLYITDICGFILVTSTRMCVYSSCVIFMSTTTFDFFILRLYWPWVFCAKDDWGGIGMGKLCEATFMVDLLLSTELFEELLPD